MKTITIYSMDIKPNTPYMCDANGAMDLLGQIIYTGYNIRVPMKTRTPQELDSPIHPFTKLYRKRTICLTPLSQALLDLSSLPGKKQVVEANKILAPFNITLVEGNYESVAEILEEVESNLKLGSSPGESTYYCDSCGELSKINDLILHDHFVECPHCDDILNEETLRAIKKRFLLFPTFLFKI